MVRTWHLPNSSNMPLTEISSLKVIDSHTEGEPTRVVTNGFPKLLGDTVSAQRDYLKIHYMDLCKGIVLEPRGHAAVVGAILVPPSSPKAATGVIFVNNVGVLGMCGHGAIGVVRTLAYLGRIEPGEVLLETPVGPVWARLTEDGAIQVTNVLSKRHAPSVRVDLETESVIGDIAYGGNWFFISEGHDLSIGIDALTRKAAKIRAAINLQTDLDPMFGLVDHIELLGEPIHHSSHSRNFVLCPGGEFDRSPCGTGLSAKLACLAADCKLEPGEKWIQESYLGTTFSGWYDTTQGGIIPTIQGTASVTAESTLLFKADDPFRYGIEPA